MIIDADTTRWDSLLRWPRRGSIVSLPVSAAADSPLIVGEPSRIVVTAEPQSLATILRDSSKGAARGPGRGWVVHVGYDAGRTLEPRAQHPGGAASDRRWPGCIAARIDAGWLADASGGMERFGDAPSPGPAAREAWRAGELASRTGEEAFQHSVSRVLGYIRAGDVYQVNLAHRLSGGFHGCARSLFAALASAASPRHGAYLEFDHQGTRFAVASASPELFLSFDAATGRLSTRPMKGTRPLAGDERELRESGKDRAELNMIVDLMRNDLGRVCELGSVRVDAPRTIERHGSVQTGVLQATATVSGELRRGLGIADVLTATFPPGSVTGAPKIRAMQIIDELEPVRRGPYCGCTGFVADSGDAWFNVMIRTALLSGPPGAAPGEISGGVLDYSIGAGIVAESDPRAEWDETMVKARGLLGTPGMRA